MSSTAPTTPPAAPPRKRRRRLLKFTIALLIAVVVVVVAVQLFLWSDYPRQIAVRVAQNVTGLRVEIAKVDIAWSGHTTIAGVKVSLPLADKPFLETGRIDATHTSLLGIAATAGGVTINGVTVAAPRIDVRQNADKSWNVVQALNQLLTPGKNATAGGPATLPDVSVTQAVIDVTMADGRHARFDDVAFVGRREDALAWKITDAHVGALLSATGEVSSAGRWPHQMNAVVKPALFRAIEPLVGTLPAVASATLQWQGEKTPTGVAGRLIIPEKTTQVGPVIASGAARLSIANGDLVASPEDLIVTAPGQPPVTLAGGTATLRGTVLTLDGVRTRFADGAIRLNGSADLNVDALHGAIDASWENVGFPGGVTHQGRATLEVANIWPRRPWVRGQIFTSGTIAGSRFETRAAIKGDGTAWSDATYVVDLPLFRYGRQSELRFEDLQATIRNTDTSVSLEAVSVRQSKDGPATLDAYGTYDFAGVASGQGYFTAVGRGFSFAGQPDLAFNINAWADGNVVTLKTAYAGLGTDAWVNLAGQYVFRQPEPVRMRLDFDTEPSLSLRVSKSVKIEGHAKGSMRVGGTVDPTMITVAGKLESRGLKFNGLLIGDADLVVRGTLDDARADFNTEHLTAFGGEGWFGAAYPYFGHTLQTWMGFDGINLADIGVAVGQDVLTGTAGGRFDLYVPTTDFTKLSGSGRIDVAKPTAVAPLLVAESVAMPVDIGDGYVRVRPLAKQAAGGQADVTALMSLAEPTKLKLDLVLQNWVTQLPLPEFSVLSGGRVELPQIDLTAKAVSGQVNLTQKVFAHSEVIGDTHIALKADGRRVWLENYGGMVLGGTVSGAGNLDFDDLAAGEMRAGVDGLSLDRLAQLDPRLVGVKGRLSAKLHTHAADAPNALGPVQADIEIDSDRATYKGIEIGDTRLRLFVDQTRVALSDDPGEPNLVSLAGGTAKVWGRISEVPPDVTGTRRYSAFASARFKDLDTEQLNQMIDPDGKPVPGRLGGEVTMFGNAADIARISGQGRLSLTKSDLGNIGPLAALYDVMRLGFASPEPIGEGTVDFRVSAGKVSITGLNYFNRGVYARGALVVDDVLNVKDSHLSGYVLGTYRPLKDLKIPFFGTLDGILDALQSSATTLRIDGTMEKPNAVPASLKAVSGDLKQIIVGETKDR